MMAANQLGSAKLRDVLGAEGLPLEQTTFRATQQFSSPNGAWLSQVHFFYDEVMQRATPIGMHTILGDRVRWPR